MPDPLFDPWAALGNVVNSQGFIATVKAALARREFRLAKREAAKALIYLAPTGPVDATESWQHYLQQGANTSLTQEYDQANSSEKLISALQRMNLVSTPITPEQATVVQAIEQIIAETGSPAEQLIYSTLQQGRLAQTQEHNLVRNDLAEVKAILRENQAGHPQDPQQRELDQVKGLLNAGNLAGGRQLLEQLSPQAVPETMSAAHRAYYQRLQGAVARMQGDSDTAIHCYKAAYELDSTSSPALISRGLAALMEEQPRQALSYLGRILADDESHDDAQSLSVAAYAALQDEQALRVYVDQLLPDQLELGLALTRAAWVSEQFDQANQVLDVIARGRQGGDARVNLCKAMTFVLRSQAEFSQGVTPQAVIERPGYSLALAWAEEVLPRLQGDHRRRDDLQLAYQIKLVLLTWQRELPDVKALTQEVIQAFPEDLHLRELVFIALLRTGAYEEILRQYHAWPEGPRSTKLSLLALDAARGAGDWAQALTLSSNLRQQELDLDDQADVILAQVQAAIRTQPDQVAALLPEAFEDEPWALLWARAEVAASQGQMGQGTTYAQQSLNRIPSALKANQAAQWATYLQRAGEDAAARSFIQSCEASGSRDVEPLARVYIELGLSRKLRELVEQASREGWSLSPTTRHIDAINALHDGDSARAHEQLERLTAEFPEEFQLAAHAAYAAHLLSDQALTRRHLERASGMQSNDAPLLMNAGKLAQQENLPELALQFAYQAHRLGFGEEANHLDYLSLYLSFRSLDSGNLVEVEPETAVQLRPLDGGPERWYFLTSQPIPGESEFTLESDVAKKLLGYRLGETVSLRSGRGGDMEITAVVDKYAYAAVRIAPEYNRRFPTGERVQVVSVSSDADAEELHQVITEHMQHWRVNQRQRREVIRQVTSQGLPAAFYAATKETAAVNFWLEEITTGDGLASFNNSSEDSQAAGLALEHGAVLDISTLVGLEYAGLLKHLPEWLPRICVSQHLRAEVLTQQSHLAQTHPDRLQRILDFIERHAEVVPAPGTHDASIPLWKELLPTSSRSALFAASHLQLPLVTEDVGVRRISQGGQVAPSVPCCGTIDLLLKLQNGGQLTEQQRRTFTFTLAQHGYARYPVDADYLKLVFDADGGAFGDHLRRLIQHFTHPGLDAQIRAMTLVILLHRVCIHHQLFPQRREITSFIAEQLSKSPDWRDVLRAFVAYLDIYFQSMLESKKDILAVIIPHFEQLSLATATATEIDATDSNPAKPPNEEGGAPP